ncbi:MAG: transglutaminase domain-containing protein [Ruminiclostridium sp.]
MKNIHALKRIVSSALSTVILIVLCACSQNSGLSGSSVNSVPTSSEVFSAISSFASSKASSATLSKSSNITSSQSTSGKTSVTSSTATSSPAQASDAKMEPLWYYYNMLDVSQKTAYQGLYDAIQSWIGNSENTQPFSYELKNPGSTVNGNNILMDMKWDNPIIAQYFNTVTVKKANGSMVFTDTDDQHTFGNTQNVRQVIRDAEVAADAFLSGLSSSMSDYDKYWYIAKKLCEETVYDYAFPQVSMRQFLDDSGVYGALVNRLSVCQGFAQTYDYLCKCAGLFSLVVSGNTSSGDHAWNIIKLDDGYYHVDTTWMQSNENRYFCLTDKQIAVDHTIISQYHPKCDGSKYAYNGGKVPS